MIEQNIFSLGARKLLTFQTQIEKWLVSGETAPVTLEIHPTERCSHHCPACQAQYALKISDVRHRAKYGVDMDFRLLDSVWRAKPEGIILSGNTGDPLNHPNIMSLFETLESRGLPTVLITNGHLLGKVVCKHILKTCRGIRVSLDAHNSELYRSTHGVKSAIWEIVLRNIEQLVRFRSKLGLSRNDCVIGVGYLTNTKTLHGMVAATKLAYNLGVDYIQFRPFHYDFTDVSGELMKCEEFETEEFQVYSSHQKYSHIESNSREYKRCHGAWFYSLVDARGDIYICCHHVGNPHAKIGSLRDNTWSELIFSERRRNVINSFETMDCLPLCRLDSQNHLLDSVRNLEELPTIKLDYLVEHHAPFL